MGIISDILDQVDAAVDSVAQDGFISSAAAVGNVITAGAVLLLILLGINVVMQLKPMTFGSAFAFGIKISLVAIFAQSWDNFSVIYGIVTQVPDSVGASILALTGSGDEAGVYESLDNMVARITAYGDTIGDQAGWVFGAVLGAIFFVLSALFAAVTAGIIAFAKIVFALMIVIAPFMIITSLFKPTQSLFEAWSRATIGYALMPVAAAGAAGIIVAIAEAIGDASADPVDVEDLLGEDGAGQQGAEVGGGHAKQGAGGGWGVHILMPPRQISKLTIWAMMKAPMPIQHMPPIPTTCIVLSPNRPAGSGVKKGFI